MTDQAKPKGLLRRLASRAAAALTEEIQSRLTSRKALAEPNGHTNLCHTCEREKLDACKNGTVPLHSRSAFSWGICPNKKEFEGTLLIETSKRNGNPILSPRRPGDTLECDTPGWSAKQDTEEK